MNEGNALIGGLLLIGLIYQFGWWAALLIVVPLAFDFVVGRGMRSAKNFRYLGEHEQALRRASQGFAVCVFALLAATVPYLWLYGWQNFITLCQWYAAHPASAWPVALIAAAFVIGFIRFRAGVRRSAGTRDDIQRPKGFLKFIIGLVIVGYLTFTYPAWNAFAYQQDGTAKFLGVVLVYAADLWCLLVGGMRFLLLSLPIRTALPDIERDIAAHRVNWEE